MHAHKWHHHDNPRGTRAHLHIHTKPDGPTLTTTTLETHWASGARHNCGGLGAWFGGDQDLHLHLGLPHLLDVYLAVGSPPLTRWIAAHTPIQVPMDRTLATVRWHAGTLWWEIWTDYFGNNPRGLPAWREGRWHLVDAIAGDWHTTKEQVENYSAGPSPVHGDVPVRVVPIPMPEGVYRAEVKFWRHTRRRARWPWSWFPRVSYSYDLKVLDRPGPDGPAPDPEGRDGYVPVPGKGENAWDCGGDGHFALSGPGRTVPRAVGDFVAGVFRDRLRNGSDLGYHEPIS